MSFKLQASKLQSERYRIPDHSSVAADQLINNFSWEVKFSPVVASDPRIS